MLTLREITGSNSLVLVEEQGFFFPLTDVYGLN